MIEHHYFMEIGNKGKGCKRRLAFARRMAERYAKDVLNLTKEKEFTSSAVSNLLDIQMVDGT